MNENDLMQAENTAAPDAEGADFIELNDAGDDGDFIIEETDPLPDENMPAENAAENAGERLFHLKHLDTEIDADEKKVVELAQKGMDYDRIRGKYEKANAETARLLAERGFIQELAGEKGMSVEEYIDETRTKRLMEKENISEKEARTMVRALREELSSAVNSASARERVWYEFCCAYPDVKAENIPAEVMTAGIKNGDLRSAYEAHLYRELIKRSEADEKNSRNRQRSTGSRKSHGAAVSRSEFDTLWYDGT